MFGTRLRTWMETHIVRSRKKQPRAKDDKKSGTCSKLIGSTPACHFESDSFERQYAKNVPRENAKGALEPQSTELGLPAKASMSLQKGSTLHCTANSLSSPESAYSTGYSTDGTSPGASVPPEYYINIRTGTHYIAAGGIPAPPPHQNTHPPCQILVNDTACKVGSVGQPPVVLSPRSGRHKRDEGVKKKVRQNGDPLAGSSTEDEVTEKMLKVNNCSSPQQICTPKAKNKLVHPLQNNLHRRTESYDENQQRVSQQSQERDSSDSLPGALNVPYQCTSPYLPGASPRQRNRIRTNPWLGTSPLPNGLPGGKSYNSQGETSSTVGSSSTLSSNGCKQTSDETSKACLSPRSKEKRRLVKEHLRDVKNCNVAQNPSMVLSPVLNGKKHLSAVTTCSPVPNRLCPHAVRSRSPASSSSPNSSPSSASEDDHHGNTSDFSDDDVTLNEMLGKFDESYVYEKETDILSDSDPTDCEDQADLDDKTDNSLLPPSEPLEEFDFIDHGSLAELAQSDSESSSKVQMTGHCTYHHFPGHTPESVRKLTPRLRESIMRRQSTKRSSRERHSRRTSRNRDSDNRKKTDSPVMSSHKRSSTYKKSSSQSLDNKNSCEALQNSDNNVHVHSRRIKQVDSIPRPRESPAKYVNLNRVLMERLINNQRNGTRSADGTPVSLRKRGCPPNYNGKYMKNHYVSKLINSDVAYTERRSSLEEKKSLQIPANFKPRSNSLSVNSNQSGNVPSSPSSVGVGLNDLDKEGDLKYRQLIQEAEHIIEDLQVKTRSDYLSPTFRCKGGMERAKPTSPLVFSVPPSPLSLRYDVYRDDSDNFHKDQEISNNNIYDQPIYVTHKDKTESEEGLLKTISKTLERIIIRSASDTNRKLDKSVSDPFAKGKGKKTFVLPSTEAIYANIGDHHQVPQVGFGTPNLLRRSSTENTPSKMSVFRTSPSKLNQNEISSQSGFRKFFRKSDKYKTSSFEEHIDKHNYPENGFGQNSGFNKCPNDGVFDDYDIQQNATPNTQDVHNARYLEVSNPLKDYSPNGNTPTYLNGFQQIPWQHRTSQAERLKHLSDLQDSPRRNTDSPELPFEQKPSLVSFRSFDLGNKHVSGSGYCPQSEPVKRKIYTCSATFEKLQKSLLRKQPEIHPSNESSKGLDTKEISCAKMKNRVVQIRRERPQTDSKVREVHGHLDRLGLALGRKTEGTG